MIDFFLFSWSEVATSLRFAFVVIWLLSILCLILVFIDTTVIAISYGRVLIGVVGKVVPADYWKFIKHCYGRGYRGYIKSSWDGGAYWNGVGNWAYRDKKTGKWIKKEPKK